MSSITDTKRPRDSGSDVDTKQPKATRVEAPPAATVLTSAAIASVENGANKMRALFQLPKSLVETLQTAGDETDLVVALDISPSMDAALPLLKETVEKLPAMLKAGTVIKKVHCAVGTFDHAARMYQEGDLTGYVPFGELTEVAARNIALDLDVKGGRGTNTSGMIQLGCGELRRIREERQRPAGYLQHLLLLTDGRPTVCETTTSRLQKLVKTQCDIDNLGHAVVVHVLCLGNDIDHDVPKALVDSTRGIVGHAKTAAELTEEMGRILTPILSSSAAFTLSIDDDGVTEGQDFRYRRCGILTPENCETLFTLQVSSKVTAGLHLAAKVGLANSGMPESSVMLKFLPDEEYNAAPVVKPPAALEDALETERLEREEQDKIRAALARNDFQGASEVSQTYTQIYQDNGLLGAAARSSMRTTRLDEMSTDAHAIPTMGADGAAMTMDALASQSLY